MPGIRHPLIAIPLLSAAVAAIASTAPDKRGAEREFLREQARERAEAEARAESGRDQRQRMLLALRLNEAGSECVAYDPARDACLVTVQAFNDALEAREFPAGDSAASAGYGRERIQALQAALLKEILEDRFAADPELAGPARDSLLRGFEAAREKRTKEFAAALGEDSLRALYRKHYPELFRGREERSFRILATSDSALADSLARDPQAPWQRAAEADLPPEAREASRGLKPGEISRPIETPYARVYLRLASSRPVPEVPFEQALPILISLATGVQRETDLEQRVSGYYQANRNGFRSPDTASFRVWLAPVSPRKGSVRQRTGEDTSRVDARTADQTRLPAFLGGQLEYYPDLRPGDFLGPIRSAMGTWYLRVLSVRPGGRAQSLSEARPRILKILYGSSRAVPADLARQEADAKDRELMKTLAGPSLAGPGARAAREEWMRERLSIRFIRLPDREPGKPAAP